MIRQINVSFGIFLLRLSLISCNYSNVVWRVSAFLTCDDFRFGEIFRVFEANVLYAEYVGADLVAFDEVIILKRFKPLGFRPCMAVLGVLAYDEVLGICDHDRALVCSDAAV